MLSCRFVRLHVVWLLRFLVFDSFGISFRCTIPCLISAVNGVVWRAVVDDDGDLVRCRWATSSRQECGSVCHGRASVDASLNQVCRTFDEWPWHTPKVITVAVVKWLSYGISLPVLATLRGSLGLVVQLSCVTDVSVSHVLLVERFVLAVLKIMFMFF